MIILIITIFCSLAIGFLIGSKLRTVPLYTVHMDDALRVMHSKDMEPDISKREYHRLIYEFSKYIRSNSHLLDEGIRPALHNIWFLFLYENKVPVKNK